MTVYVVTYGNYEDWGILGIYTSKSEAERLREEAAPMFLSDSIEVEEFDVDRPSSLYKHIKDRRR
jgi:hypothetical protein